MQIKVIYDKQGQIDENLDQKIERAFDALGFRFSGSGCNRINGKRDLIFESKD